ncbi:chorismate-binding protein [Pseudochryseolinea flava]|uniref:Isochorismate synthase n=1 Tax=Pseudochryseolinea flava TaxID=2059302 RepID=A0A364Y3N4_9BACT|nr:chorismate-binding protein [Pseudochryseolinea flava]RAW01329.1 isochorismate synthase [Pseudochryseolinea flava]
MNTTLSVSLSTRSETEYLSLFLNHAFQSNFAIAVWKLPNDKTRYLVLSRKHQILKPDALLEDLSAGFLFAPFDRSKERIYLEADHIFRFTDGQLQPPQTPQEITSLTWLEEFLKATPQTTKSKPFATPRKNNSPATQTDFTTLVKKGIADIEEGKLQKIVPSRTKEISLPQDFDIVNTFQKLCTAYPSALVSFVSSPETGSWLGASPEALVSVETKSIFRTVALAGTKPFQEGINLKSVAWTQKEIEEQALVERYVISCFKKIRVREYDEHGPKTVIAGNLMHLKSEFTVDMNAINFPQLGSVMLELLHPTSAVCGMPLESAQAFLKDHEGYDREFYAGYLGPVNINQDINLFVNIRCLKLLDNGALLYAGAGVTEDSIPEHEWTETEIKFNTLLNVLKNQS